MARTILVVDDDPHIREVVCFALEQGGVETVIARDGREALERFHAATFDLVILDVGLPEVDGLEVCRAIRRSADTPILFLSARDEEVDRILGLELGGDDYVVKPFSPRELVARVKAILKRWGARANDATRPNPELAGGQAVLAHGLLELDRDRHEARFDGRLVALTATEFAILEAFLAHPHHVRDRAGLVAAAYDDNIHVSDRTVDSHIKRLRRKFRVVDDDFNAIETLYGAGYSFTDG